MSDSTPIERPVVLRSPFNGQAWTVPPEATPELVEELLKRGFERIDDDTPVKSKTKGSAHGKN